jgi:hypothetical protein
MSKQPWQAAPCVFASYRRLVRTPWISGTQKGVNRFFLNKWVHFGPRMKRNFVRRLRQLKFVRRFMQCRRSKPPPDLWQFGLDARDVILERTSRAINGTLSADEARRMILEKHSAAIHAQLAYTQALLQADPVSATRDLFNVYGRAVRLNRKRLCKKPSYSSKS